MKYDYVEFGGVFTEIGRFDRNYWVKDQNTLSRYIDKCNNTDCYITVFSYQEPNFKSKYDAPLYFDVDNEDLEISKRDTITLCNILSNDI